MLAIHKRLERIEAAINDVRREASWVGTLNGARNPDESLQHAEELESAAELILEQAEAIAAHYGGQVGDARRRALAKAAKKGGK